MGGRFLNVIEDHLPRQGKKRPIVNIIPSSKNWIIFNKLTTPIQYHTQSSSYCKMEKKGIQDFKRQNFVNHN